MTKPEQEPDRQALQAAGTHPAPCARHCEAKAYEIEIRSLKSMLYTTPPAAQRPWVGLTDEEVKHEWEVWRASLPRYIGFAQGIETKLKEKNNG
jgi:hypothetical protein